MEPNNDDAHAQAVTLPCDISGSFGTSNDSDVFRFPARKGEVWWIEATAERLGSPADPTFLIQQVVANAPPKDLASAEDTPDPGGGARFGLGSVDASVRMGGSRRRYLSSRRQRSLRLAAAMLGWSTGSTFALNARTSGSSSSPPAPPWLTR